MRFVLDHDVDVAVAHMLRRHGHECWSAADAGLSRATDDSITVYADERGAVVITHDKEFSRRRRRNAKGRHLFLRCVEPVAVDVLKSRLDEVIAVLQSKPDIYVSCSEDGVRTSHRWD